ncbi:MAG TPA: V-type ATP synthase subunit D [Candidatus Sabulitectum sp.]|nr:V-type ATP synthase subunit D [Candidatus Sabulitectum sp.]HPF32132.1 V-type ATP synthase subunit D [Candidatus Sabulitectum sp.]HPR22816.1 V-type ATP synthase subunit D [Candidatus Sabulitectum sp.]
MAIEVKATRMEMLQLKKRLKLAKKGHKLLKDKLDELMRQFKLLIADYEGSRADLEKKLEKAYGEFLFARAAMEEESLLDALRYPGAEALVQSSTRRVMNLTLPVFKVSIEGRVRNYGMFDTPPELDEALEVYKAVLPEIIKLAEQEKAIILIANEIDSTRRRVNSLEYVMIPEIEEAIRYIRLKLDEMERGNTTRLMKVKEMVEANKSI